jgi:hypothetical protein
MFRPRCLLKRSANNNRRLKKRVSAVDSTPQYLWCSDYRKRGKSDADDALPLPDLYWIYSHECSAKGAFHTHFLTHIPVQMRDAFRKWLRRRVSKWPKEGFTTTGAVKVVGPPSDPIGRQWRFFQYLCKGLDPGASVAVSGYDRPVPLLDFIQFPYYNPGHIACKNRTGVSRNLSATVRKNNRFVSVAELGKFDKRLLYNRDLYEDGLRWRREEAASEWLENGGLHELLKGV